jgi:hypothetical protein
MFPELVADAYSHAEKQSARLRGTTRKTQESIEKLNTTLVEVSANAVEGFTEWQGDPVGFCETHFGEEYTEDVKALMCSVRDHRATIAKSANSTGKSHAAARIAIWFLLCFPGAKVFTFAAPPEDNLRNILWGEIGYLLEKHKKLLKGFKLNDLKVTRSSNKKWFLTGVTIPTSGTPAKREAAFSGKHAPYMLFIGDEADGVPHEVYKGVESCMTGGHTRILLMFNPRHESGPIYLKERDNLANVVKLTAFNHPNVITGEDRIPGAVDRDTTLRRINEWSRALMEGEKRDAECYEVPDFLVGTTTLSLAGIAYPPLPAGFRRITEPQFSYMVLGEYPAAAEGQLISKAWVAVARARWDAYDARYGSGRGPHLKMKPILGGDVSEGVGRDSNQAAFRYPNGFVPPLISWGGIDTNATANKFGELYHEYNCHFAAIDGNGFGSGVAPKMADELDCPESYGVKVQWKPTFAVEEGEFALMRDQLWWYLRCWLRHDPNAMLPPDDLLCEELTTPLYTVDRGKIKVQRKEGKDGIREKLRRSPDRAEALMMTFYNEIVEQEDPAGALAKTITRHNQG